MMCVIFISLLSAIFISYTANIVHFILSKSKLKYWTFKWVRKITVSLLSSNIYNPASPQNSLVIKSHFIFVLKLSSSRKKKDSTMKNYCYYYAANTQLIFQIEFFSFSQFFFLDSRIRNSNCVDLSVASSHHLSLFIAAVPFVIIINNKLRSCSVFYRFIYFVVRLSIVCCTVQQKFVEHTEHNSQFSFLKWHLDPFVCFVFEWIPKIIDQSVDIHMNREWKKNDEKLFKKNAIMFFMEEDRN